MVVKPRCPGQPVSCCSVTNNSSSDRPVMTSGITIGEVIIPENKVLPLKRRKRASASPAIVPSSVASVADVKAMRRLRSRASRTWSLRNNSPYQRTENPPQTVAIAESLKEYTMTRASGT